jgi:flavin-dependent dehydrogenase
MVIGADGANSCVAKEIDAGEYDYAIAFQERIRIPGGSRGVVGRMCCVPCAVCCVLRAV